MVVVDFDGVLDVDDLPTELMDPATLENPIAGRRPRRSAWRRSSASRWRKSNGLFIAETLQATGGNREEAAEMLGIGERTLYRKIKEYQLVKLSAEC